MIRGDENSIVFRRFIRSVRWCFAILVSAAFLLTAPTSQAQELPKGTITIVVPFAAGAVSDALARLVARKLAELLDRNVIVENKAGANTILGTTAVARSQPDGRTLLLGGTAFVVNTALYKGKLAYDPVKDFEPVSLIATSKSVLVANSGLGIARLSQLLELAKSRPGEITYASAGSGNMTHLGMEVFKARAGIEIQHVPYRGANPALTDVLAGHVPLMFINPGAVEEYVKNGRLIGIAVTGEKRLEGFPDVPTFVEAGLPLPELNFGTWFGILAPAGTPKPIISQLNAAVVQAVEDPQIRAKMQPLGFQPEVGSPEAYTSMLKAQLEQWPPVVERAGIKIE